MTKYVEFRLDDGENETILVEVDDNDSSNLEPVAKDDLDGLNAVESGVTFAAAINQLRPVLGLLKSRLDSMRDPADEVAIEFGVKLSGQAGLVLTKVGAETSFKISMKWQKKTEDPPKSEPTESPQSDAV